MPLNDERFTSETEASAWVSFLAAAIALNAELDVEIADDALASFRKRCEGISRHVDPIPTGMSKDEDAGTREVTMTDAAPFLVSVVVESARDAKGTYGQQRGIHLDNVQKALSCLTYFPIGDG